MILHLASCPISGGHFTASILTANASAIPLATNSVDLIVTSPPYANAIDYMRAHKFSLVWFDNTVDALSELRSKYIGSERTKEIELAALPEATEGLVQQLAKLDMKKAKILRKYFLEMKSVLSEMYRVLRPNTAAILVVGPSTMRGINVQTHNCLADIAKSLKFDVVSVAERNLDRNKRMMPARFGKKGDSVIEQRMHQEYVVGLLKPLKE